VTGDAGTGLRERKKQRTHAEITAAAARLFAERGFDAVTIDEIAEAADVSPRTFYRYVSSKEDLVFGDLAETIEGMERLLAARPADEPVLDSLRAIVMIRAEEIDRDPERTIRQGSLIRSTPALQLRRHERQAALEAALTPLVAARLGTDDPTDLRAALVVAATFTAFRVATVAWLDRSDPTTLTQLLDDALAQLAAGLGDLT